MGNKGPFGLPKKSADTNFACFLVSKLNYIPNKIKLLVTRRVISIQELYVLSLDPKNHSKLTDNERLKHK